MAATRPSSRWRTRPSKTSKRLSAPAAFSTPRPGISRPSPGGELPDTLEGLTSLPGIGRKTANLVLGDVFHKPCIVTDTHCIRICGRLGLSEGKDPYKVEMQLREVVPPMEGGDFCHRLVHFGRETCAARKPKCGGCEMASFCPSCEAGA